MAKRIRVRVVKTLLRVGAICWFAQCASSAAEPGSGVAMGVFPNSFAWDQGIRLAHRDSAIIELHQRLQGVSPRRIYRVRAVLQVPINQRWLDHGEFELGAEGGAILETRVVGRESGRAPA